MTNQQALNLVAIHQADGKNQHPPATDPHHQLARVLAVWLKLISSLSAPNDPVHHSLVARRIAQLAATCITTLETCWSEPTAQMAETLSKRLTDVLGLTSEPSAEIAETD